MKYLCATEGCLNVAIRGFDRRARCEDHFADDEPPVGAADQVER